MATVSEKAVEAATKAFATIISEGGVMEPAIPAALEAAEPIIRAEILDELLTDDVIDATARHLDFLLKSHDAHEIALTTVAYGALVEAKDRVQKASENPEPGESHDG